MSRTDYTPAGTRRATILKRRSGKTASLIFTLRRVSLLLLGVGVVGGFGFALTQSVWVQDSMDNTSMAFFDFTRDNGFSVQNLLVEGRHYVDREGLKTLLDVEKNEPILAINLRELQEKITRLTWVKDARVERHFPNTLYVHIMEREPVALWQRNGQLALVDREGVELTSRDLGRFKHLMIIVGDNAPQNAAGLIDVVKVEADLRERVEAAKWVGNRRWDIMLKNGITIRLPEHDMALAIKRLTVAHDSDKILDRKVDTIDMRDEGRIIVQTAPGAAAPLNASFTKDKNI